MEMMVCYTTRSGQLPAGLKSFQCLISIYSNIALRSLPNFNRISYLLGLSSSDAQVPLFARFDLPEGVVRWMLGPFVAKSYFRSF